MKLFEYVKKAFTNLFHPVTREYLGKRLAQDQKELTSQLADIIRTQQDVIRVQKELLERLDVLDDKILRNKNVIERTGRELRVQMTELLDPALYEHALGRWYQKKTGMKLDLDDPQRYSEKIQWMKLYDPQNPLKTVLADKILVRDYVAEKVSGDILIPLLKVYDTAAEIDFDELPDSFVLKANHGCGYNRVVVNKSRENLEAIRKKADFWLKEDFSLKSGFELHYRDIPRKLFAEEYIGNGKDAIPDYKFWCFDGKVHYICVIVERDTQPKMAYYDTDWNKQGFVSSFTLMDNDVPRPERLEEMIETAEKLSEGFPHVRVDLYILEDGSYRFGELTFTPASGGIRWDPPETDLMMGALMELPAEKRKWQ